jgi:flavin reductase (DIM6/NTAB) family NADH-FMN oxidoreductase RutF
MKNVDYAAVAERAIEHIKKGGFLTVQSGDALNTMTIGWATMGFVWRKPTFMVAVRRSRYTFGIMEKAADFTVSIPLTDLHDTIMFCGTQSGRDVDKFQKCDLHVMESRKVISPIINTPGIHFECKIVFKAPMDPEHLIPDYKDMYPQGDYHTLYFGEILACYEIE